jgi:UPF0755 protein
VRERSPRTAGTARAAITLAVIAFVVALFQPLAGHGGRPVRLVIAKQSGVARIADLLDAADVVPSASLFELRATLAGDRGDLKPGTYYLRRGMSYGDVLDRLTAGPATDVETVTVPEGLSRVEVSRLLRRDGVRGDYIKATVSSPLLDPRRYGAQHRPPSLEGFLFPATYDIRRADGAGALAGKQLEAFRQRFSTVGLGYARSKNLTAFDVLTIASMVEREAQLDRERPLIAAVIYNRLHAGMPLGVDATVRYATGNWTSPLTASQLASDSPYHTRRRMGLPPGPIGSPGLASIEAAARPKRTGYLYYVVKPGGCGEHAFSSSFAQFQRDQQRYQAARQAAGGRSPTNCPSG